MQHVFPSASSGLPAEVSLSDVSRTMETQVKEGYTVKVTSSLITHARLHTLG